MSDDYDIPVEEETNVKCPVCGSNLFYIQMLTDIAYERRVLVQSYFCKKCLFKKNDVVQLDRNKPIRISYPVRNRDDIRTTLYRSPDARVVIPEIGAEIDPGDISSGEITTVEGILTQISEKMDIILRDFEGTQIERKEAEETLRRIREMDILPFTLVLEDESGMSRIQSSRAVIENIEEKLK
jgi:zinc finger protein